MSTLSLAQTQEVPVLGINLEGYDYPFEVHYIQLDIQGSAYQMA